MKLIVFPFIKSLDKWNGSCAAVEKLPTKICILEEKKVVSVKVFSMITRVNEAGTLIKHISCNCKWKVDSTRCSSNQKFSTDKC